MNELNTRRHILTQAAALLTDDAAPSSEFLYRLGQVYRISCTDADASDEAASVVDEADALLERLRQSAARRSFTDVQLPELTAAHAWLRAPRSHHAEVLSALDRLGGIQAGLSLVAGGSTPYHQADVATNELVRRIDEALQKSPAALFDLGVAALEHIAQQGHVPGEDRALIALDGAVHQHLSAALRGQAIAAPQAIRVRPIAAEQAEALGKALAMAMQRTQPLRVAPDLLDLTAFPAMTASRRSHDLMLHNAAPSAPVNTSVELMRDVRVTVTEDDIEVELLVDEQGSVMLVPLINGEPGTPCSSRSGNHPRHLVFAPTAPEPGLDGYALVVGDRLAFLKR